MVIGARGFQQVIDFGLLRTLVPQKVLDAVASVTTKAMKDEGVDPAIILQVTQTMQTGYRPLEVHAKAA